MWDDARALCRMGWGLTRFGGSRSSRRVKTLLGLVGVLAMGGCAMEVDHTGEPDGSEEAAPVVESAGAAFGRRRSGGGVGSGKGKRGMNDGSCHRGCDGDDLSCRVDAGGDPDLERWCDKFDALCRAKC